MSCMRLQRLLRFPSAYLSVESKQNCSIKINNLTPFLSLVIAFSVLVSSVFFQYARCLFTTLPSGPHFEFPFISLSVIPHPLRESFCSTLVCNHISFRLYNLQKDSWIKKIFTCCGVPWLQYQQRFCNSYTYPQWGGITSEIIEHLPAWTKNR